MIEILNGHIIEKDDMLIRPGASKRVSFRGMPEGWLQIREVAKRGPNLGDNETPFPFLGNRRKTGVGDLASPQMRGGRVLNRPKFRVPSNNSEEAKSYIEDRLEEALLTTHPDLGSDDDLDDVTVVALDNRPRINRGLHITVDGSGKIVIVWPDPPDFPREPFPPVIVKVVVRDGQTLGEKTLTEPGPSPARFTPNRFPGHDIIDVTFTNPNDFPILVHAFLHIHNPIAPSITRLNNDLLNKVFRGTLLSLAPTISVRKGKLRVEFDEEFQDALGVEPITKDLGFNFDGTVDIDPVEFSLLSHREVITILARELMEDIAAVRLPGPDGIDLPLPPVPSDFVTQTVDAFFTLSGVRHLFDRMGLRKIQWEKALERRPILAVASNRQGRPDEVAIQFNLKMTKIEAGLNILEVEADSITARLLVVLVSYGRPESHPVPFLRDEFVNGGSLLPRFDLSIDISRIDVDIETNTGFIGKPFEFVAEQSLEVVANWLKDYFEDLGVELAMSFLEENRLEIGEIAGSIMRQIANRDHVYQQLTDSTPNAGAPGLHEWVIHTFDPAQLAVPFVESDDTDHRFDDINVILPPSTPIDGPMPASASDRLGQVDHMVFLMMENRSFDHMLGYLSHPNHRNRTRIDGLDGLPVLLGGDYTGTLATPQAEPRLVFAPDPGHGVTTTAAQIAGGAMNGFVSEFSHRLEETEEINPTGNLNDPERILKFYTAEQVDTYDKIARAGLVLDRWFSSIPGPTYPNRFCYYAGYTPTMNQSEIFDDAGYQTELTLFDLLDHQNQEWIYFESSLTFLRVFERYRLETTRIRPIHEFYNRTAPLPPITFIDPNFFGVPTPGVNHDDDHPPVNIKNGQDFIQRVCSQLEQLPEWSRTMLVILYDEHGGFADHVPPPGTPGSSFEPAADGSATIPLAHPDAKNYGVRVPAMVLSPLVVPREVKHQIYDHASVFRTIVERFMPNLRDSAILPERVRRARHLGEVLGPPPGLAVPPRNFPLRAFALGPRPDAVIHAATDDYRPHLKPPPDSEDFHYYLSRIGNPLPIRRR